MQNMRRVPCSFLPLFHIHRHAGFEFHGEFILVDGNLFVSVKSGLIKNAEADTGQSSAFLSLQPFGAFHGRSRSSCSRSFKSRLGASLKM